MSRINDLLRRLTDGLRPPLPGRRHAGDAPPSTKPDAPGADAPPQSKPKPETIKTEDRNAMLDGVAVGAGVGGAALMGVNALKDGESDQLPPVPKELQPPQQDGQEKPKPDINKRTVDAVRRNRIIDARTRYDGFHERGSVADLFDEGFKKAVEEGAANPYAAAASYIRGSDEAGQARYTKEEQIRENIKRRASQQNRARRQGISVGAVMAIDAINDAKSEQDIMKAMVSAAAVYPGFGQLAAMVTQGQISARALQSQLQQAQLMAEAQVNVAKAQAEAKRPQDPVQQAAQRAEAAPFSTQGINAAVTSALQLGVTEEQMPGWVANNFSNQMQAVAPALIDGSAAPDQIATAKAVLAKIAGEGAFPTLAQIQQAFGGSISDDEAFQIAHRLYGNAGVRGARTWTDFAGAWLPNALFGPNRSEVHQK